MIEFWKNKRTFITGATGLVGSWLVKQLVKNGCFVVVLIRDLNPQSELVRSGTLQKLQVVNGSMQFSTLERAINEYEIDTVFHLGAQTIVSTANRSPLETFESNIRATYHLLEACRIHQNLVKRIVIASSDKAYGSTKQLPYTEEMPLMGRHPYDVSKSCTDLIAQSYFYTYQLPIAIARCGNIFGGGDLNWSRIVPGTIKSLIEEKKPVIRSDGQMTRDYIFVEDVVSAYLLLAEHLHLHSVKGEAFNFGPSKPYSVIEIVSIISKLMDKSHLSPIILNQSQSEIPNQFLDSKKACQILDWSMNYSLEEGLKETILWYENFFGKILETV